MVRKQRSWIIRQSFQNNRNRLPNCLQTHCLFPEGWTNMFSIRNKPQQGNIINWTNRLWKNIIDELNEIPNSNRTQILRKTLSRHQLWIHPRWLPNHSQIQHRKTLPIRTKNLLLWRFRHRKQPKVFRKRMQRNGRNSIKQIRSIHLKKTKNTHYHKPLSHRNRNPLRQSS